MINNIKTCRTCKISKSLENFYLDKKNNYHFIDCKSCTNKKTTIRAGAKSSKIKWNDYTFKNLTEKICLECNEVKHIDNWTKSSRNIDGLGSRCKQCHSERSKKYSKPYSELQESEKKILRKRKRLERRSKKDFYNKKDLERYHANPQRKIASNYRTRLGYILKKYGLEKKESSVKYLGCSVKYLMVKLESKFKKGMNWENHGTVWHVDHIKPCASFDLTKKSAQRECFHYSNLQPLFATTEIAESFGHTGVIGNLNKQDRLI